jgi:rubrerythrin
MDDIEFDLDRYLRASKRVDLSAVEWDRIADHPLPPEHARCLAYMMDIESHTVVFLRDLLATRAAFDPDVSAFLSCWVYEELWHGEAFSRFLGEAGYRLAPDREVVAADDPYPSRPERNRWIRRAVAGQGYLSHAASLLGSAMSRDFVAIHMTWGAANELTTLSGYHRLIAKSRHPQLVTMLQAIIKDERRHFAFYRAQARLRLARSATARRIVRWSMENLWAPVGTGVRPQRETDHAVATLFGDAAGQDATIAMQTTMNELPGLAGSTFLVRAASAAAGRSGPADAAWDSRVAGRPDQPAANGQRSLEPSR